jgi:hypothetical protein
MISSAYLLLILVHGNKDIVIKHMLCVSLV